MYAAPSCAHFRCVQKYLLEKSVKGLSGCPFLGLVPAWRVWVLRLLFFLTLLFGLSASESEVAVYISCWSVDAGGYWIHLWRHLLLGLVGRLKQWLELDLVLGCIQDPELGKEMVFQTCVRK